MQTSSRPPLFLLLRYFLPYDFVWEVCAFVAASLRPLAGKETNERTDEGGSEATGQKERNSRFLPLSLLLLLLLPSKEKSFLPSLLFPSHLIPSFRQQLLLTCLLTQLFLRPSVRPSFPRAGDLYLLLSSALCYSYSTEHSQTSGACGLFSPVSLRLSCDEGEEDREEGRKKSIPDCPTQEEEASNSPNSLSTPDIRPPTVYCTLECHHHHRKLEIIEKRGGDRESIVWAGVTKTPLASCCSPRECGRVRAWEMIIAFLWGLIKVFPTIFWYDALFLLRRSSLIFWTRVSIRICVDLSYGAYRGSGMSEWDDTLAMLTLSQRGREEKREFTRRNGVSRVRIVLALCRGENNSLSSYRLT